MAVAPQRTAQGAPSVLVEPGSHASAGGAALLRVHVRNITTAPQDLSLSAIGLEGAWLPAQVTVPAVPADATVTVELVLTPPVGASPGDYPFVVAVEARGFGAPPATTLAEVSLRVDGVSDLVLTVEPADSRAVRRRRIQVVLANTGDRPVRVLLDAVGDGDLAVDLSATDLDIGPHETARIAGQVRARRPRLAGSVRRSPFHVMATGARAPQRFDGSVALRPLLGSGALKAVAVTMVSVLWIVGVLAALPRITDLVSNDGGQQTAADGTGAGADGAGADGAPGTGGADGSAPPGPGEGTAAPAPVPGVRVSGVVTGAEPEGVRVDVVPASALDATTAGGLAAAAPATALAPSDEGGVVPAVRGLLAVAAPGRTLASALAVGAAADRSAQAAPADGAAPAHDAAPAPVGKVLGISLPVELSDEASQRRSTVTETNGTWAFADLSPTGRYLLVLSKPGYQTQRFLVTGTEAAAKPLKLAMVPGTGRMSGTISGPAGRAGGVQVTLSDGTTTVTTRTATSGRVGYWEVDGLSTPSTYLVSAGTDRLGAQSVLLRLDADGSRTVDLTLADGVTTLAGTVRGTDSLGGFGGLGGLTVTATAGEVSRTATTVTGDRAGTFVLPDLPVPASYTLTISGDGYATQTREVDLAAAGIAPLDIVMTTVGGSVEGTVADPSGAGIAGAGLTLEGPTGTYKTMSSSDGKGTFRFSGIAPGQYVLTAAVFAHQPASAQVTVASGTAGTVDLVLVPIPGDGLVATSYIRGSVRDASTGGQVTCPNLLVGVETCRITVSGEVTDSAGLTTTLSVVTQPDTDYTFPQAGTTGLLPGLYRLTVSAPGYEPGRVNVTVPMGQVVEATPVALEQSPSIVGTVQARVGSVPTTTCVIAVPGTGVTAPTAPCDTTTGRCTVPGGACSTLGVNGSYEINRLSSGSYTVWVIPPVGSEYVAPQRGSVSLVPGSSRRFDAVLDRLGRLNVTVMRSDGTAAVVPEPGATIVTNPVSQISTGTITTDPSGLAQVTGLAQGTYTVTATRTAGAGSATLSGVTVGLNQEVSAQLVLTQPVSNVSGSVVTQLVSGGSTPVGAASVTVTGTTGFSGLAAVRSTGIPAAVTTGTGAFTVCTVLAGCPAGSGTYLPLVTARVDVQVQADGYEPYSATDVPTSALAAITLNPSGVPFRGRVQLQPAITDPAELAVALAKVRFDVLSAPPGVGQLSLTVRADGTVTWSDSSQPVNPAGGRMMRPGTYELVASLPGYDNAPLTVVVDPDEVMAEEVFTLRRFGFLRVQAVAVQDPSVPVLGAIMTLTLPGGVTQRLEAHPGDSFIDFGDLPTGSYAVDVRAPNYARVTASVLVTAGQSSATPSQVSLRRLGAVSGVVQSILAPGWTEALPDAQVTASRTGVSFTGTTTTDGSYRITGTALADGLEAGTWNVTATAAGHTSTGSVPAVVPDPVFSTIAALDVAVQPVQLTAQRGELRVFALDGDTGVPDLTMQISYRDSLRTEERVPNCVPGQRDAVCPGTAGLYIFLDVLPLTYNLNISGGSYSPLTLPVTVGPGRTVHLNVPITTPAGSVQGLVLHQTANGGTVPVEGAVVTLDPPTGASRTATSDPNGQYTFTTVPPATYTLSTTSGGLSTSRTVTVQPAQGLVVDLVLTDVTRQVRVTVTSANDTDLTGALVALTGGSSPPAAQPVVRTAAGADTYTTTFNQVAVGTWAITVSGPSGHLGSHTGSVVVPATGTGVVQGAVTVTETQLALRATTSATGAPTSVAATVTQGATATPVTLAVGGGDTVLFLPATGATVTATITGSWSVVITGGAVPSGATFHQVTVDLVGRATTTTATGGGGTVLTGADVSLTARVQAQGGAVNAGTLQMQRRTSTGPDVWTDVGAAVTATGSNQTVTATSDAGWGTGSVALRVAYSGSGSWGPSASTPVTVTMQTPTTTAVAWAAGTITATVSPGSATGTVTFQTVPGAGQPVNISTCVSVLVVAGAATCTYTPATGTVDVRAVFTGTGVFASSTSGTTPAG